MTTGEAASNHPIATARVNHRPTWTTPVVTQLDVTRSLNGSGTTSDGVEGLQFGT